MHDEGSRLTKGAPLPSSATKTIYTWGEPGALTSALGRPTAVVKLVSYLTRVRQMRERVSLAPPLI